ncbi:MAG: cytochrome c maturation protein CcmE [Dehalococcoidia bacterium]
MAEENRDPIAIPLDEETEGRSHRTRLLILGVVVALAVGYMIYAAFPGNALYFLTVSEFMSDAEYQDGRVLRVSGKLLPGSFQRQEGSTLSHFQLVDSDNGGVVVDISESMTASYVGVMPDLFFNPHSEIILEGRYGPEQVFETDSILVKCPSKYQSLEEELQQTGTSS